MAGHTPGPWEYEPNDRYGSVFGQDGDGRDWNICDIGPPINLSCSSPDDVSGAIRRQAEANARLIASAPELLEALEAVQDMNRRAGKVPAAEARATWAKARTAITKAKGEA